MKSFATVELADQWLTAQKGAFCSVYVYTEIPVLNHKTGEVFPNGVPKLAYGEYQPQIGLPNLTESETMLYMK